MLSKVQAKQIDHPQDFTVSESIKIPLLTEEREHEGKIKMFNQGVKYHGTPVQAIILKKEGDSYYPIDKLEGFIIEGDKGVYLIPSPLILVPENEDEWNVGGLVNAVKNFTQDEIQEAKNVISELQKDTNTFSPEQTLGFSYKQLAVISLVGIVLFKLLK